MTSSSKIYTRGGDKGKTSLISGQRVEKSHPLLEAYGTVDELNAICGIAAIECKNINLIPTSLQRIQNQLFVIGSQLACTDEKFRSNLPALDANESTLLEDEIDQMTTELPELKNFILPGGSAASSYLHLARTVCRRCERLTYSALSAEEDLTIDQSLLIFLNRLSDWFFTAARFANLKNGIKDNEWQKTTSAR